MACAFQNCPKLKNVRLPDSLTTIESNAFEGCTSLDFISLPDSVEYLGRDAFRNCTSLEDVRLSKNEDFLMQGSSFVNTPWLKNRDSDWLIIGDYLYCYTGHDTDVVVPEGVKCIAKDAFRDNQNLQTVHLPDSLMLIRESSFEGCTNLRYLNIPDNVGMIEYYAFRDCTVLDDIELPEGLQHIGTEAFSGCECLKNVYIPEKAAKAISRHTFFGTPFESDILAIRGDGFVVINGILSSYYGEDTEIDIPDDVRLIGSSAFSGMPIESVHIPEGVQEIGLYAFSDCTELENVDFPVSLMKIENFAFKGCKRMSRDDVPDYVDSVAEYAFSKYSNNYPGYLSDDQESNDNNKNN